METTGAKLHQIPVFLSFPENGSDRQQVIELIGSGLPTCSFESPYDNDGAWSVALAEDPPGTTGRTCLESGSFPDSLRNKGLPNLRKWRLQSS